MNKEIVFFSDLEGTLITEEGEFDKEQFEKIGEELNKLAEVTQSKISIIIVSPVGPVHMTKFLEQMDISLMKLERKRASRNYTSSIKGAAADFNDLSGDLFNIKIDNRIDELKGVRGYKSGLGADAKYNYVYGYIASKEREKETSSDLQTFYIYAGNGLNDLSAIKYVHSLKNGLAIAPTTKYEDISDAADVVSKLPGTAGIADCIKRIRESRMITKEKPERLYGDD